jgi:uncharacterized protein
MKSIFKLPFEYIAAAIISKPFIVAGTVFALLLIAVYGSTMITMEEESENYLNKNNPVGILLDQYSNGFSSDFIIIIVEGEDVTEPGVVEYLSLLEEDLEDEKYVKSVSGLPDILKLANSGILPQNKVEVENALETYDESALEKILPSKTMTFVFVELKSETPYEANENLARTVNNIITMSHPPAGVSVEASGNPIYNYEVDENISEDMGNLIVLALFLMVIAMCLFFSHVRYRLLPVLIVFCGLVFTFGFMGLAGIRISSIVIAAFPVLIGIGIDYAIQFHSRFDEEIKNAPMKEAVITTITCSGPSILLAMVATGLGFIALIIMAPIPMVADFGIICLVGLVCCYVSGMIIIPTFAVIAGYRPKKEKKVRPCSSAGIGSNISYNNFLGEIASKTAKNPIPVLLVLLMLAVGGIQYDDRVIIDTDEDSMVNPNLPAKISFDKITNVIGSTYTIIAYIKTDSVKDPDTLKWIDGFGNYVLSKHDDLNEVTSITTYLKEYNNGIFPSDSEEIKAVWNKIPEGTRDNFVSGDTECIIEFSMNDMSVPQAQRLIEDMQTDLDWYSMHPGMNAEFTGDLVMFSELISQIKDTKNPMTYLGIVFIFIFLLAVYRKLSAVSPVVPIIMIIGWNGLIMYSMGFTYSFLTATLSVMTIGIASEYTILIMERYHEEKDAGKGMLESIRTAIQKIGTAITISGMTTVFGFSALILSTSPIIKNFGTVTVLTVGFSLVGAIIVMPAVISIIESVKVRRISKETKSLLQS